MNITIPRELFLRLKRISNMSSYIAAALRDKMEAEERARRLEALAAAYRQAAEEERRVVEDWDAASGDAL